MGDAIEVDQLRKACVGRAVVDGISFSVAEGEIFAIVGANGAGKTTTVECLQGLRAPDAGSMRILGHEVRPGASGARGEIAPSSRTPRFHGLRVKEVLKLFVRGRRTDIDELGVWHAIRANQATGRDCRAGHPPHGRGRDALRPARRLQCRPHHADRNPKRDRRRPRSTATISFTGQEDRLAGLSGVRTVRTIGAATVVEGAQHMIPHVCAALVRGAAPADLRIHQPTLEEAIVPLETRARS